MMELEKNTWKNMKFSREETHFRQELEVRKGECFIQPRFLLNIP